LFISESFSRDFSRAAWGTFQRMEMFIQAIKELAALDILFFVPPDVACSLSTVSFLEKTLAERWRAAIRLFLCPRRESEGHASKWELYGRGVLNFSKQSNYLATSGLQQIRALEDCLQNKPDIVFAHRFSSMIPLLLTRKALPRICFDLDDIEHTALLRAINQEPNWRDKLVYYAGLPALCWGEYRAIRLASLTFVCSDLDRDYLRTWWRHPGVVTVPNAVHAVELQKVATEPTVLFLGSFNYKPNAEAARFLLQKIWPRVYREMPGARLIIAGKYPKRIEGLHETIPGVEFTGFVSELRELYAQSRVVCAPILSGAGTRIKIIEAAMYGKPIVSTRIGAEGLEFRDGHELLLQDDARSFANACVELLANDSLCERLGLAAHEAAVRYYSRAKIEALIRTHIMAGNDQQLAPFPGPLDEARSAQSNWTK
jgi:glycosyltransferase involved in cell wall biosynthesis